MKSEFEEHFQQVLRRVGWQIRNERLNKGMNQSDFAHFCGLTRSQIRSFEDGLGIFRFSNFLKICFALKLDPQALMSPADGVTISEAKKTETFADKVHISDYENREWGSFKKILLEGQSAFEWNADSERLEIFVIKGPVYLRAGVNSQDWPTGSSIRVGGEGQVALVNFTQTPAEVLLIRR